MTSPGQPAASHPPAPAVPQPGHPLHALTTSELRHYRRQLEHALADQVIGSAPVAGQLRDALADVLAEQDSRTRLQQSGGHP